MAKVVRKTIVAVLGDSGTRDQHKLDLAYGIGKGIVEAGHRLLTGGRGGVMQAACKGGRNAKNWSDGDIVAVLPGDSHKRANPYVDTVLPSGISFARNYMIAHAQAVVAVGGGAGTLSEIAYAWHLKRLIICLRCDGWSGKLAGQPIDYRRRFDAIENDQAYAASDAGETLQLLDKWLETYLKQV